MSTSIKIAYFQQDIVWEESDKNLKKIDNALESLDDATSLFILPEMFHAGFTMNPEKVSEYMDGEIISWLKDNANKHNITIIGSVIVHEQDNFRNRLLVISPNDKIEFYDKRHLFSIGGENEKYSVGQEKLITKIDGWRTLPLICYDLRFPVWSRCRDDYDLLIYIANWPKSRREVWKTLLKARAIENQCFVIGVNRVGNDNQNSYAGDSMVINAKGEIISSAEENREMIVTVTLDLGELSDFRNKFPLWKDADNFTINTFNNGKQKSI